MTSLAARRALAAFGSLVFLVVAPGFVVGLVPFRITRWGFEPPLLGLAALRAAGCLLIVAGLAVLLESFWRFAMRGLGTPAPILPTRRLVVSGLYRHVRNPMYLAVAAMIAGQALLFGNVFLLAYGALVWCAFHIFVLVYEEPTLKEAYPTEYLVFCRHVPRWIPLLQPWREDRVADQASSVS
jgi:protein-S-isoprenylcysteine O-methyltransferase Ste14